MQSLWAVSPWCACGCGWQEQTSASTASERRTTSSDPSVKLPTTLTNSLSVSKNICAHLRFQLTSTFKSFTHLTIQPIFFYLRSLSKMGRGAVEGPVRTPYSPDLRIYKCDIHTNIMNLKVTASITLSRLNRRMNGFLIRISTIYRDDRY